MAASGIHAPNHTVSVHQGSVGEKVWKESTVSQTTIGELIGTLRGGCTGL
jgi:hypothetical protein